MIDIQKEKPLYEIEIDNVGIKDLEYPIRVLDKRNNYQNTIGKITMSVDLPNDFRGTHMSRFVSILNNHRGEITFKQIQPILEDIKKSFDAQKAHFQCYFTYFIEKKAPVSEESSLFPVQCMFFGELDKKDSFTFKLGVTVPVLTLCPCSKEISSYGAHNQRANIKTIVQSKDFVWIEDIIDISEKSASAPIYSLLKRTDEKHITELAYDNPYFVEDVVRKVAHYLINDERITYFYVEVESFESIHTHNAIAKIEKNKD